MTAIFRFSASLSQSIEKVGSKLSMLTFCKGIHKHSDRAANHILQRISK